jgi:hypothetical protein
MKVHPKEELYCTPSISFAKYVSVDHEIELHAITLIKVIKVKV